MYSVNHDTFPHTYAGVTFRPGIQRTSPEAVELARSDPMGRGENEIGTRVLLFDDLASIETALADDSTIIYLMKLAISGEESINAKIERLREFWYGFTHAAVKESIIEIKRTIEEGLRTSAFQHPGERFTITL